LGPVKTLNQTPFMRESSGVMNTNDNTAIASTTVVEENPGSKYPFSAVSFTAEQLASTIDTINQLKGILPPMPGLTPLERRRMSKLGSKTRGFADAALEAAKTDSGILPQSISLDTFEAQDQLLRDISLVQTHVTQLKSKLDDALLLIGNWVYSAARTTYAVMKTDAAKTKLQEQVAVMRQRFVSRKKEQSKESTETNN
jgi:hypothetical protein